MNTLENLLENGIGYKTACNMLQGYSKKIGTDNGVYRIVDITYNFKKRGKDVILCCSKCGRKIHFLMNSSRNEWGRLIKSCPCEKVEKEKTKLEKLEKNKKEHIEELKERVGKRFGDYEITSLDDLENSPKYTMRCIKCGDEKVVSANSFHQRKYFECIKHKSHYEPQIKYDESYIGRKNNFLTVKAITRLPNKHRAFLCECDCGNTTIIEPTMWERGIVKSCGCQRKKILREINIIHGHSGDRLYKVYNSMKQRCYNPNTNNYENYGGRGIRVCQEWLDDFVNFYEWAMNSGYDYEAEFGECTLDRINPNGNYCPENCRWVDAIIQANNKRPKDEHKQRKKKTWTINGETKTRNEWCEIYGTSIEFVKYRVNHKGMSIEEALKTPKMTDGRPRKTISQNC